MSSFWILTANSFMQEPVGFTIKNGRAEMNDFVALITNPQLGLNSRTSFLVRLPLGLSLSPV